MLQAQHLQFVLPSVSKNIILVKETFFHVSQKLFCLLFLSKAKVMDLENSICGKDHSASGVDFTIAIQNTMKSCEQLKILKYTGSTSLINVIKGFSLLT